MKLSIQVATLVGVIFAVGAVMTVFQGPAQTDAAPKVGGGAGSPARVIVRPLHLAEDRQIVQAIGTGKAERSVTLYPSVDGEIVELSFHAGDHVEAGDVLVRLDSDAERLAVRAAEVEKAELRRRVQRLETLAKTGTATTVALDEAETALELADVRLDQARVALEDRVVRAPFAGVLGIANVDPGDRITTETAIATLDDRSSLLVDFLVPERVSARIRVGQHLPVRAWALGDEDIPGTLVAIGSRIDPETRMLLARARIPNPEERLRPGTSFAVHLTVPGEHYPVVPEVAVLWNRDGSHVWRVTETADGNAIAEKVFVTVVRREKGRALVSGALAVGDRIVVEGLQSMRPGRSVEVVDGNGT